jgi:hypothetical protein
MQLNAMPCHATPSSALPRPALLCATPAFFTLYTNALSPHPTHQHAQIQGDRMEDLEREIKGLLSEKERAVKEKEKEKEREIEGAREKEKEKEKSDSFETPSPEISEKVRDVDENADGNDEEKKGDRANTPDDTENVSSSSSRSGA